jgi:hypothetical protein
MLARFMLLAGVLISLSGCVGKIGFAPGPFVAPVSPSAAPSIPAMVTPAEEAEPTITLMGTVMDVSLSARIILLEREVQGFRVIALTEETELASSGGHPLGLRDMRPGMTVQATGRPGESDALVASQVLVLLSETVPAGFVASQRKRGTRCLYSR